MFRIAPLAPVALVAALLLAPMPAHSEQPRSGAAALLAAEADAAFRFELERSPDLRLRRGLPIERLPTFTDAERAELVAFATGQLERLASIDAAALTADERVTLGTLRWRAERVVELDRHAALDFHVTPYALGFYGIQAALGQATFATRADVDRSLRLLDQLGAGWAQIRTNLEQKAARGLRIARPEIDLVVGFLGSLDQPAAASGLVPKVERLAALGDAGVGAAAELAARYEAAVRPPLARLIALFDDAYRAAAPAGVGLGQYPGGDELYAALVRLHTTLDLTPEEIHRMGLEMVGETERAMAAIRAEVGFAGSAREFHAALRTDPRFLATTPEEVGERLMAPMRAFAPKLPELFGRLPEAPYAVERLDPTLEGSMTFGFYQPPSPAEPRGIYYYNGSKLGERPLVSAAALIFHELAPGHHFHFTLQSGDTRLPDIRRESYTTAFTEGWAEYASGLAEEFGGVPDPYGRYGRLLMRMFVSVRLVVDTGMNRMGWTREQAAEFMRERLIESDTQIATETLRYSCDIPGQALAYQLGAWKLRALRAHAAERLGARFDLRAFHDLVLATGAVPLTVLEARLEEWIAETSAHAGH